MLIGVVSDSHDNLPAIGAAVAALSERGVGHLLHAGDVVAPFAAKAWRAFEGPITAVFGNNDGERAGLAKVLDDIHQPPHALTLGDRRIVLAHDEQDLTGAVIGAADLVIFGHSHRPETRREGSQVLVNPGEVGGWLTGRRTCAVVGLHDLSVEVVRL